MTTTLPTNQPSEGQSAAVPTAAGGILRRYAPRPGAYDETFAAPGQLRPHWHSFAEAVEALGETELKRRWDQAQRMVHENGIALVAHTEPHEKVRQATLDALPLLVDSQTWATLSEALVQRARLLNLLLSDLYGPQTLVAGGFLPPELVLDNPAFLRPAHGQRPADDCFLRLYAADVARSPDGNWWVVADWTESPWGSGYALENRIITSRMLPQIIRQCQVERLAGYFMAVREALQRLATRRHESPRIVLLSPGATSPHYFEDAYLARYLGYTLVEGGDLTMRNNHVMLKTLAGLLPVDVIWRRIDDASCDPLELGGDSESGVAGLLQAVRAGNVAVANAIGSGLVQSPAVMAYLPNLCQHLLGQPLKLPSVATWWCGEEPARDYVLENRDRLVVRQVAAHRDEPLRPADELARMLPAELAKTIAAHPASFVGQERVEHSSAPAWHNGTIQRSQVGMRVFLVATGESYTAMPGGLTQVGPTAPSGDDWSANGRRSKDTWVLSDQPVRHVSLLQAADRAVALRRSGAELPSRVADNLFWLGRLVERAEGAARLLRTLLVRLGSESESTSLSEVRPLLRGLAYQGQIEPGYVVDKLSEGLPPIGNVLASIPFDERQPNSVRSTVSAVYHAASVVRDRLSIDSWRIMHRLDQELRPAAGSQFVDPADALAALNRMIIDLAAFAGLAMESMTRAQGWRFLDLGRRLERAVHTINLVRNTLVAPSDNPGPILEAVLEVADSLMTYRSRYLAGLHVVPVLDLVLTDETNPRSVAFQFAALADHVNNLPRDPAQAERDPAQRLSMSALHTVRMIDVQRLCGPGEPDRAQLDRTLNRLADQLPRLSEAVTNRYLVHAGAHRQLGAALSG